MGVSLDKLTDIALDAFEDEMKSWSRQGTDRFGMTMLIRRPYDSLSSVGPADVTAISSVSYQRHMVHDRDVNQIILRAAMEKALLASASIVEDQAQMIVAAAA